MSIRFTGLVALLACLSVRLSAVDELGSAAGPFRPRIREASGEAELAIKKFKVPPGFKVDLFAAEPLLANPVCFNFDEKGRVYVVETFRLHAGVTDIRGHMNWLDDELASTNTAGLERTFRKFLGEKVSELTNNSERIQLLEDTRQTGKADRSTVFAEGFNSMVDGLAAGVLARHGSVYLTDIPNLWLLQGENEQGIATSRKVLHSGFGVRAGFLGHDLHGLRIGPDGKLYFSIGDRGAHIKTSDGRTVTNPEYGAVYRCNMDGTGLEIFAFGLRNPQELAFDDFGNLFTGDNNSDAGDPARWVYLVEGGDSGWRVGYQFLERPKYADETEGRKQLQARGPWLNERQCYPRWDGQAAFLIPPLAIIGNGPSGLTHYPGVGLPEKYNNHFFLADFKGSAANSLVHSIGMEEAGAGFTVVEREPFISNVLVTDVEFSPDCRMYISDWVDGWAMPGKGRLYRIYPNDLERNELAQSTARIIREGMSQRSGAELKQLLGHPDQRVRQEAQFALVEKKARKLLIEAARSDKRKLARLHGVWGLGQLWEKHDGPSAEALTALLRDKDREVAAQAAKVVAPYRGAQKNLLGLLNEKTNPRGQFFAALALGKTGDRSAIPAIVEMLRQNNDQDLYLRHAGVMALSWLNDVPRLLEAAQDGDRAVRMAVLLALRRLERVEVAALLEDKDPLIALEAARAITDASIYGGLPRLAALAHKPERFEKLKGRPELQNALARRVVNASFRQGTSASADALVRLGAARELIDLNRSEAIFLLAEWAKPSGRDEVTGLWRPLPERDSQVAANALRPHVDELLANAPDSVQIQTARAAEKLSIKEAGPALFRLVSNKERAARVRLEALKAMAGLVDDKLSEAIAVAAGDSDETLRQEATRLQAKLKPRGAVDKLVALLESGTIGEQQNAFATLATVESAEAEKVLNDSMDKLIAGKVNPELQLDVVEAAAKRNTLSLKAKLEKFEAGLPASDELAKYRIALSGGNAAEGKKIFLEKVEASCIRCHKIGDEGGEVGPVLSGIGQKKPRDYILESIVLPNKQIAQGFETMIITLKNGTAYAGILKSEDGNEVTLNSPEDGIVKIKKSDVDKRERGLSGMPEGLGDVLTRRDLRDLVEFLATQK